MRYQKLAKLTNHCSEREEEEAEEEDLFSMF